MPADSLLVDTGSSNTWVGALQPYQQTQTSVQTRDSVVRFNELTRSILFLNNCRELQSVNYGNGESFEGMCHMDNLLVLRCLLMYALGTEFNDLVSFDSDLTVFGQSIGAAIDSSGFDDSDGVLGCVFQGQGSTDF